jgi:hypothetical protein
VCVVGSSTRFDREAWVKRNTKWHIAGQVCVYKTADGGEQNGGGIAHGLSLSPHAHLHLTSYDDIHISFLLVSALGKLSAGGFQRPPVRQRCQPPCLQQVTVAASHFSCGYGVNCGYGVKDLSYFECRYIELQEPFNESTSIGGRTRRQKLKGFVGP